MDVAERLARHAALNALAEWPKTRLPNDPAFWLMADQAPVTFWS